MKFVFIFFSLFGWATLVQAAEVFIHTKSGPLIFNVEVADTPEKAEKGLMYRLHLNADQGMLFVDKTDRVWHMWMKNTFIPLDMIFISQEGRIVKIVSDAKPLDLTILSSDKPVASVLEIGGGLCSQKGINVGDRVTFN